MKIQVICCTEKRNAQGKLLEEIYDAKELTDAEWSHFYQTKEYHTYTWVKPLTGLKAHPMYSFFLTHFFHD